MKEKYFIEATTILVIIILLVQVGVGQISPPGLGTANIAGWFALGLRQNVDSIKKVESVTYAGLGFKSNPDNYNPYFKLAIFVLNQEFYHQFHKHWQYSLALSYRRQNEYERNAPYRSNTPSIKQEFRIYGRYSYILKKENFKFVATFRQEFRKFYTPDFKDWTETFQIRSRLRLQLTLNLDKNKIHKIIGSYEALFSASKKNKTSYLEEFNYQESRFCFYYSLAPPKMPFVLNLGYMNNLVGNSSLISVHYLGLDIIFINPFSFKQQVREKINSNMY